MHGGRAQIGSGLSGGTAGALVRYGAWCRRCCLSAGDRARRAAALRGRLGSGPWAARARGTRIVALRTLRPELVGGKTAGTHIDRTLAGGVPASRWIDRHAAVPDACAAPSQTSIWTAVLPAGAPEGGCAACLHSPAHRHPASRRRRRCRLGRCANLAESRFFSLWRLVWLRNATSLRPLTGNRPRARSRGTGKNKKNKTRLRLAVRVGTDDDPSRAAGAFLERSAYLPTGAATPSATSRSSRELKVEGGVGPAAHRFRNSFRGRAQRTPSRGRRWAAGPPVLGRKQVRLSGGISGGTPVVHVDALAFFPGWRWRCSRTAAAGRRIRAIPAQHEENRKRSAGCRGLWLGEGKNTIQRKHGSKDDSPPMDPAIGGQRMLATAASENEPRPDTAGAWRLGHDPPPRIRRRGPFAISKGLDQGVAWASALEETTGTSPVRPSRATRRSEPGRPEDRFTKPRRGRSGHRVNTSGSASPVERVNAKQEMGGSAAAAGQPRDSGAHS